MNFFIDRMAGSCSSYRNTTARAKSFGKYLLIGEMADDGRFIDGRRSRLLGYQYYICGCRHWFQHLCPDLFHRGWDRVSQMQNYFFALPIRPTFEFEVVQGDVARELVGAEIQLAKVRGVFPIVGLGVGFYGYAQSIHGFAKIGPAEGKLVLDRELIGLLADFILQLGELVGLTP